MSHDRLRWGLLSTARINRRLIPAVRAASRAELVAVASRTRARAEAYAAEWGISRALASYEELLADPGIDAVYVSVPNHLHAEWTVRATQAGKHVLCEKPLALTTKDVDDIAAAAVANGVVVMEAVMYRTHPLILQAQQMVRDGAVGRVRSVRGAFSFNLERQVDVRWKQEMGGGSLWDVGSYPVSFIRAMVGDPEEVFGWAAWAESGVDETFAGLLRYPSGVLGAFDSGFRSQFRTQAEVTGSEGVLTIDLPYIIRPESRIVVRRGADDKEEVVVPHSYLDAYQSEVETLTAAVLDGAGLPVTLASSRANVATLVALGESARTGKPVTVSYV